MTKYPDQIQDSAAQARIEELRHAWQTKPVLRYIYQDYYRKIAHATVNGPTVEVGSGPGHLGEYLSGVISTDIVLTPWVDAVADAQRLPFADQSVSNIVAVDLIHHLQHPGRFFHEVVRVLASRGRLILLEPAITPVSFFFYRFFHPEPVNMRIDPLRPEPLSSDQPFDANQAIPSLLFGKYLHAFRDLFPDLTVVAKHTLSLLAYPLSGGFRPWCLVPSRFVGPLLRFEDRINPLLGRFCGFRLFIVLEKGD